MFQYLAYLSGQRRQELNVQSFLRTEKKAISEGAAVAAANRHGLMIIATQTQNSKGKAFAKDQEKEKEKGEKRRRKKTKDRMLHPV